MDDEFYQTIADKFIFRVNRGLLYTENDVWAETEDGHIRVGITDFFQRRIGDIIYAEFLKTGTKIKRLEEFAQFESIKAVSSAASPFEGIITEVNTSLNDKPEMINEDPYGAGWLVFMTPTNLKEDLMQLLTPERYFDLMKSKIDEELNKNRSEV